MLLFCFVFYHANAECCQPLTNFPWLHRTGNAGTYHNPLCHTHYISLEWGHFPPYHIYHYHDIKLYMHCPLVPGELGHSILLHPIRWVQTCIQNHHSEGHQTPNENYEAPKASPYPLADFHNRGDLRPVFDQHSTYITSWILVRYQSKGPSIA